MDWTLYPIHPFFSELIYLAVKATILLSLAIVAGKFLKKTSASARHFQMSILLLTVSILPVLAIIIPDADLPLPKTIQSYLIPEIESSPRQAIIVNDGKLNIPNRLSNDKNSPNWAVPDLNLNFLIYIWLLGFVFSTGRVLVGLVWCAKNRREAKQLKSNRINILVAEFSQRIGLRKSPVVLISDRTAVAYVDGITKPVLFLPSECVNWPEDRLISILLHELAHFRRKDHITWPLFNLAISWLWFNPLIWIVLGQIRREKERACDDYAVSYGYNRARYARHLLDVYTSLREPELMASVNLSFARKNHIRERILYMLNHRIDRRPVSRTRRYVLIALLVIVAVPLISIKGFSTDIKLINVTQQERSSVIAVLEGFYSELSRGSDFQYIRDKFLTSDYFDDPVLTLESLDKAQRRPPFDNTLRLISEEGIAPAKKVGCRVVSIERDGDELVVFQQIDVVTDRIRGEIKRNEDGTIIRILPPDSPGGSGIEECYLVNSLTQKIRLRQENGEWKISEFNDGVTVMRMDTDNPYGPIFLIWMEDIDQQTTPFGAGVFKVFPRELIPDARNTKFVLEK